MRLSDDEAKSLGLNVKAAEEGRNTVQYYITPEEKITILQRRNELNERKFVETIRKIGKDGETLSSVEKLQSEPIEPPEGFEIIKISTSKTTGQQWIQYKPIEDTKTVDYLYLRDRIIEDMKEYSPTYPKITYDKPKESHCLVFDPSDIHIGKIALSFETGEIGRAHV